MEPCLYIKTHTNSENLKINLDFLISFNQMMVNDQFLCSKSSLGPSEWSQLEMYSFVISF